MCCKVKSARWTGRQRSLKQVNNDTSVMKDETTIDDSHVQRLQAIRRSAPTNYRPIYKTEQQHSVISV